MECKIKQNTPDEIQLGSVRREIFIAFLLSLEQQTHFIPVFPSTMNSLKS
jgi:hypothetical protein